MDTDEKSVSITPRKQLVEQLSSCFEDNPIVDFGPLPEEHAAFVMVKPVGVNDLIVRTDRQPNS